MDRNLLIVTALSALLVGYFFFTQRTPEPTLPYIYAL